jgi:CDP-2,3-bis-(O-geranylgeranyl)-sn-glycerol synthase
MTREWPIDPFVSAAFIVATFVPIGISQALWFRSRLSAKFAVPLDNGATFRGRRLFGDHKTLRGFVILVPAAGLTFLALSQIARAGPDVVALGIWQLPPEGYALLGCIAGLGFMLGELPNSFIKRQLGVPPGGAPAGRWARGVLWAVDRLDSTVGMLAAISLVVPTPWQLWFAVCVVGPAIHGLFSLLLSRLRLKGVPA